MNAFNKSVPIGLLIALVSISSPISAQSDEISARGQTPFTTYDKDGNDLISEEEFNAVRGERMATRAAEGRQLRGIAGAPSFSKFDINGDGQLTRGELVDGQKAQMEKRREMGMGQGRRMSQRMGRNMPNFSEYDLDGDGQIVEKEFSNARIKRIGERAKQGYQMRNLGNAPSFADIDSNGDGQISPDEFAAHQAQHRQQRTQ